MVVPYTKGISDYFKRDEIFYFNAGDVDDLCRVVFDIYENPEKTVKIIERSYAIYKDYTWKFRVRN